MRKHYIHGFCEELNYQDIILYIHEEVDSRDLYKKLEDDLANHLYRFDSVRANRPLYAEDYDLQGADNKEIVGLLDNEYSVPQLRKDKNGFFIEIPGLIVERGK